MPSCSIIQCGARKSATNPHLTTHRLPQNKVLRQKWLAAIGIENIKRGIKSVNICSMHFTKSSFNKTLDVIRLRDNAVPSLRLASMKTEGPDLREIENVKEQDSSTTTQPPLPVKNTDQINKESETESTTSEEVMPSTSGSLVVTHHRQSKFVKMQEICVNQRKNIKRLNEKIRRQVKKISNLQDIIFGLKKKDILRKEQLLLLEGCAGSQDFRKISKSKGVPLEKDYFEVCRVCLALDVRMFDMKDFNLTEMFQNVTGISVCDKKDSILRRVCWECAARLKAAATFRNKALLSDALLKDIAHMNKSNIAKLKHIYRSSLKSPLTIGTVFHEVDYEGMEILNDETDCEDHEPSVNLPKETNVESDPLAEDNSNIQIKYKKNENSEVYYNDDKVLSEEDGVLTNAIINDDCYLVIVTSDEENRQKLDVGGDTVDESISKEIKQSKEQVASKEAKKVMIRKVGASCEQGNRLNIAKKQKTIALKEKDVSVTEISEKKGKSLTVQKIMTVNRMKNQLTLCLSSKHSKPIAIQDKSPSTSNVENKKRDKNDGGFDCPGFDNDGIADTDVLNDKIDPSEGDHDVLSDKENYSSDDDFPLEKSKESAAKTASRMKNKKDPNDDGNITIFTITDLTFEEQIAEIVKRQESENYKNSYFKCTQCFKGFLDENAYQYHMSRHTDQFGEFECKICKKHFKLRHVLSKHMSAHTHRYSCNECTFVTMNRYTARRHERWHKGTKYPCPHCPEEFAHHSTYMGHLRIKHPSDFACEICGYSFVSAKGRELHKRLKHRVKDVQIPEDGPFCELCNVRFISSEAHQRHLSVSTKHNTDQDSREPNQPKKDFKALAKRKRIWMAEGQIPCEQCGVQLKGSQAYNIHFRRMHPDKNRTKYPKMKYPSMCEVCGRMISTFQLKHHPCMYNHERPFKCDLCDKAFKIKSNLKLHQRLHSPMRPTYPCSLCGKHFSNVHNRQRHMIIHTGLRPHKCEVCEKTFKTLGEKKLHITYVHLKKPWPKRNRGKRRSETRQSQLAPQDEDMDMQARLRPQDERNGAYA